MFSENNKPLHEMILLPNNATNDEIDKAYHKKITEYKKKLFDLETEYNEKKINRRKSMSDIYDIRNNMQLTNQYNYMSNYVQSLFSNEDNIKKRNTHYYSQSSFTTLNEDGKLHTKVTENKNGTKTSYEEVTEIVNKNDNRKHIRWVID